MFHRNMKSGIILAFMFFLIIFKNWLTVFWSFTVTCQLSLIQLEYFLFVYKLRLFCTLFSLYSLPGCLVIQTKVNSTMFWYMKEKNLSQYWQATKTFILNFLYFSDRLLSTLSISLSYFLSYLLSLYFFILLSLLFVLL